MKKTYTNTNIGYYRKFDIKCGTYYSSLNTYNQSGLKAHSNAIQNLATLLAERTAFTDLSVRMNDGMIYKNKSTYTSDAHARGQSLKNTTANSRYSYLSKLYWVVS